MDEDWTKRKDVDIQAFIRNLEKMKAGGQMVCPFCGGTVTASIRDEGEVLYSCDSCDMRIDTRNRSL